MFSDFICGRPRAVAPTTPYIFYLSNKHFKKDFAISNGTVYNRTGFGIRGFIAGPDPVRCFFRMQPRPPFSSFHVQSQGRGTLDDAPGGWTP